MLRIRNATIYMLSQIETQMNEIMKKNVGMQIGDAQGLKLFVF